MKFRLSKVFCRALSRNRARFEVKTKYYVNILTFFEEGCFEEAAPKPFRRQELLALVLGSLSYIYHHSCLRLHDRAFVSQCY